MADAPQVASSNGQPLSRASACEIEIDDTWVGGAQAGLRGSRQLGGRKAALVLAAVERRGSGSGRVRMEVIPDFKATTIRAFVDRNIKEGSTIYDGLKSFEGLDGAGYRHIPRVQPPRRRLRQGAKSAVPLATGRSETFRIGSWVPITVLAAPSFPCTSMSLSFGTIDAKRRSRPFRHSLVLEPASVPPPTRRSLWRWKERKTAPAPTCWGLLKQPDKQKAATPPMTDEPAVSQGLFVELLLLLRWLKYPYVDGKPRYEATPARTGAEAKALLRDIEERVYRERRGFAPRTLTPEGWTVGELMRWWLDEYSSRSAAHGSSAGSIRAQILVAARRQAPGAREARGRRGAPRREGARRVLATDRQPRPCLPRSRLQPSEESGQWLGGNPAEETDTRRVPERIVEILTRNEVLPFSPRSCPSSARCSRRRS